MICKIKARRSKSVDLSRSKHLWCSGNTIVFQTVVDGSSPSRCSLEILTAILRSVKPLALRLRRFESCPAPYEESCPSWSKEAVPQMDLDLAIAYLFSGTFWVRSQMENRKMTMLMADDRQ